MSQREATVAVLAEMNKDSIVAGHLVDVELDSGNIRLTDINRDVVYNTQTYQSAGQLLSIDGIEETINIETNEVSLTLSGIDQAFVSTFLAEEYIDRRIVIYKAFLNAVDESLIDDPILMFEGRINGATMSEDPDAGTHEISVSVTNQWVVFERVSNRRTNDAEHQSIYPGDMGFQFTSELTKEVLWGRTTK